MRRAWAAPGLAWAAPGLAWAAPGLAWAALVAALAAGGLAGCLDHILEAPYLFAPGLGEVRAISPSRDGRLLAATSTGVYVIGADGKAEKVDEAPADAVTAHPDRTYTLHAGRVASASADGDTVLDATGVVDVLAGYDELVVLTARGVELRPADPTLRPRPIPIDGARTVALGPEPDYLVVTPTALLQVGRSSTSAGGPRTLATGLVDARAAAMDGKGRIYVAQGDPTELFRVEPDGTLVSVAKWLGDVRDMHFGLGQLPAENLYIANGAGSVDYVRPP